MVWKWLAVIGKGAVELAKVVREVADVVVDILDGSPGERAEIVEYKENIQLRQIQLQYLQHEDNINLQAEIARRA